MKSISFLFVGFAILGLSACTCLPPQPTTETVATVSQVVDEVKDELNAYLASTPSVHAKTGVCYSGSPPMTLTPEKVTLTLKTVATSLNEPSAGLTAPIGVISFDPSYAGGYSKSRTQTLVVPLTIDHGRKPQPVAPGDHPLAAAISQFRDGILAVNHDKTPCLQYSDKANFKLSLAFDVVNKTAGGFGLKLAVFKLGDKQTATDEAHQTLDIEFSMPPGQMMIK